MPSDGPELIGLRSPPEGSLVSVDMEQITVMLPRWSDSRRLFDAVLLVTLVPALPAAVQRAVAGSELVLSVPLGGVLVLFAIYILGASEGLKFLPTRLCRVPGTKHPGSNKSIGCFVALVFSPSPLLTGFLHVTLLGAAMGLTWQHAQGYEGLFLGVVVLLPGLVLLLVSIASLRRPQVRITGSHLHLKEWRTTSWLLDDLQAADDGMAIRLNQQSPRGMRALTEAERGWLVALIRDAAGRRQEMLRTAGHDLQQPAIVPEGLRQLQNP